MITYRKRGFTLIELSIVLVIIGLIVGGVLVGQDLIRAAEVRAQITQIEKYNSAVNTFRGKFGGIPGDLQLTTAQQYGFVTTGCDGSQGHRDGNGLIDGSPATSPLFVGQGETALFWEDLGTSGLIEGTFPNGGALAPNCGWLTVLMSTTPGSAFIGDFMPAAKIGHGNFLSVYETSGFNWFAISQVTSTSSGGVLQGGVSLPVIEVYNIDRKIDDGLPASGTVQAVFNNNNLLQIAPNTSTAGGTSASCYDTTTGTYSITVNNGSGGNCALSVKMQ